jgi:hypothetical protein
MVYDLFFTIEGRFTDSQVFQYTVYPCIPHIQSNPSNAMFGIATIELLTA